MDRLKHGGAKSAAAAPRKVQEPKLSLQHAQPPSANQLLAPPTSEGPGRTRGRALSQPNVRSGLAELNERMGVAMLGVVLGGSAAAARRPSAAAETVHLISRARGHRRHL